MFNFKARLAVSVLLIALFASSTYVAISLNSDLGKLEVKTVRIVDKNRELYGLIYRPLDSSVDNPYPCIVLAHGISESKEIMSNLGLELARRGYVVLCIDLPGHGNSDGTIEGARMEPDLGVQSAIEYLDSLQYVNSSAIGLVGHSLGAGAVRAADVENAQISATVLIGGGIGTTAQGPQYGTLNSTFPKNLLVIIGQYDVLFSLADLTTNELPSIFNSSIPVEAGILYGNFQTQTARKLVTPPTTHLFESVDPTVIQETILWMENALQTKPASETLAATNMIYFEREVFLLISIVGLFGTVFLAYDPMAMLLSVRREKEKATTNNQSSQNLKAYLVWGILNLALFFPMIAVGLVISFPPLVFGSSIAWWVLATGVIGLLLISRDRPRLSENKIRLKTTLKNMFVKKEILIACILFVSLFATANLLQLFYSINLRILAPIFQELSSPRRILAFFAFIPFFSTYFVAEGLYLHELQETKTGKGTWTGAINYAKVVFAKIAPFLIIIALQYLPKLFFNIWVFPSFIGFITEFLWLVIPIFIITTVTSTWFYRNTHNIFAGAVLNTLTLAWIASVVFPF